LPPSKIAVHTDSLAPGLNTVMRITEIIHGLLLREHETGINESASPRSGRLIRDWESVHDGAADALKAAQSPRRLTERHLPQPR